MIGVEISILLFSTCLTVVYSDSSLPKKTFRCNNGKYIYDSLFCDTMDHCRDGSDESNGCDWYHCNFGEFACDSPRWCKDVSVRCNTKPECPDGSDEWNCGDEINVKNCSLSDGKFLCKDGKRCLDFEYTCDGACNCFDCSDEKNCTRVDKDLLNKCPHSYFPTPDGPQCLCDPDNEKSKKLCAELKDCTGQGICQQRCSKYKERTLCSCFDDYEEIPGTNGFKCRSKVHYGNTLLYSTSNQIKLLNLTTNEVTVIKNNVECGDLTAAHDDVYYTSYYDYNRIIYKTSMTSKITTEVAKSDSQILSTAIDYITNNVYFTTTRSLSVCSSDGRICTEIKCCNVSYVALAPKSGLMFFTMKSHFDGEEFIVKSNMDGSDESLVVDGTFHFPAPVAAEESIKKLYWFEITQNVIHSVLYSGSNNQIQSLKLHGTMVSFTSLGSKLYFTKTRDNEIYAVENIERFTKHIKNSTWLTLYYTFGMSSASPTEIGLPVEMLSDFNSTRITDNNLTFAIRSVYGFNPILQKTKINNPCSKSSCSGLCLLRKDHATDQFSHTCVCDHFAPIKGDNWCKDKENTSNDNDAEKILETITDAAPVSSEKQSDNERSGILVPILLLVVVTCMLVAAYVAFRKWNCYGYYDMIRNCGSNKSNEQENIYSGEDL